MATEDKEVLHKVWEGRLPVCFRLAQNEWRSTDPEEVYVGFFNYLALNLSFRVSSIEKFLNISKNLGLYSKLNTFLTI